MMDYGDRTVTSRRGCIGSTMAYWEAALCAYIAFHDGQLPFGLGNPKQVNSASCLEKMVEYGLLKECSRHRGHYYVAAEAT